MFLACSKGQNISHSDYLKSFPTASYTCQTTGERDLICVQADKGTSMEPAFSPPLPLTGTVCFGRRGTTVKQYLESSTIVGSLESS